MKCPTCRRQADPEQTSCQRCGTDLSTLQQLLRRAETEMNSGWQHLADARFQEAHRAFMTARKLRTLPESAKGLALACLGMRRYTEAIRWYAAADE